MGNTIRSIALILPRKVKYTGLCKYHMGLLTTLFVSLCTFIALSAIDTTYNIIQLLLEKLLPSHHIEWNNLLNEIIECSILNEFLYHMYL